MIIHAYLTDGFYGWAEIFLESFLYFHGSGHRVVLTTRDLTDNQIENLHSLYPNLEVKNRPLNIKKIASRARMSVDHILKIKNHIENNAVTNSTFIWKQAISVEDRYRSSILEVMEVTQMKTILFISILICISVSIYKNCLISLQVLMFL